MSDAAFYEWADVLLREPCVWCGRFERDVPGGTGKKYRIGACKKFTIDHVIPKSMGGSRWSVLNIAPACYTCNQQRGNRSILQFLIARLPKRAKIHRGRMPHKRRVTSGESEAVSPTAYQPAPRAPRPGGMVDYPEVVEQERL